MDMQNFDPRTVVSFGQEWSTYDQSGLPADFKTEQRFNEYFDIFPWGDLPDRAVGADVGCGSGRWAVRVAPRVDTLHCIDASAEALEVARRNLSSQVNCILHHASVGAMPLAPGSLDFCYSLGVLHHVPDTPAAIQNCAALLKPGAPFLLYLYYALDQRPWWYRGIWRASDLVRRGIAALPFAPKRGLTEIIAVSVYWPMARLCRVLTRMGLETKHLPLSWYSDKSLYVMRTNAFDRFATPLEQRFSRSQIATMMRAAGLEDIRFSESPPFWCAVGRKRAT